LQKFSELLFPLISYAEKISGDDVQHLCCFMDRSGQVSWTSPQHATSTGVFFLNFEMDIYNRILHLSNLFYNFTRMFSSLVQVFVANHTSMIDFIILEQMTAFAVIMQKHPGWVGKDPKSSIHLCFLSLRDF